MRKLVQCSLFFYSLQGFEKNKFKMEQFELVKKFIEECDEKVESMKKFVEECNEKVQLLNELIFMKTLVEECNEKVKLFNELIQIDGDEWREMMAELTKKEFEDQQRHMQRRIIERQKEEQEDWDRHLEEVGKRLQIIKFFEELPNE